MQYKRSDYCVNAAWPVQGGNQGIGLYRDLQSTGTTRGFLLTGRSPFDTLKPIRY